MKDALVELTADALVIFGSLVILAGIAAVTLLALGYLAIWGYVGVICAHEWLREKWGQR